MGRGGRAPRRRFPRRYITWRAAASAPCRAVLLRDATREDSRPGLGVDAYVNPSCRAHIALLVADVTARTGAKAGGSVTGKRARGTTRSATARSTGRLPFRYFMVARGGGELGR